MEQQLAQGTIAAGSGRTLMNDRKNIAKTLKDAQRSSSDGAEILNSGLLIKTHVPGKPDIVEYPLEANSVASSLMSAILVMKWYVEASMSLRKKDVSCFVTDYFKMHYMHEDSSMSSFLKVFQMSYSKQLYKTLLTDLLKLNSSCISELVNVGKTSSTRRFKWILDSTGQLLAENHQLSVLVNLKTRRPEEIISEYRDRYSATAVDPNYQWQLQDKPPSGSKKVFEFQYRVTDKDLDTNDHTNTFVYYLLALESLVQSIEGEVYVKQMRLNFQNETRKGTLLAVSNWKISPTESFCEIRNMDKQQAVCVGEFELYTNLMDTPSNL